MRDFRNYDIWKDSMDLVIAVYRVTESFPSEEKYSLTRQIRRASVSIPSNIAEGCSRSSEKEFVRFVEIALGSAFEVETQLFIALQLELLSETVFKELLSLLRTIEKRLNALRNRILHGGKLA